MSRIFISHSSLNETEAVEIKVWIETNGWDGEVFLDLDPERGLVAGENWKNALKEAVHRCEAVLPLISKEWLASKWCLSEVGTARLLGKQIIPILIDNTNISALPADMTSEQIVDQNSDPNWEIRLKEGLKRANLDPTTFVLKEGRPPYPGLKALTEDDAAIFFGRDAQIVRGLDRIRAMKSGGVERLMVILGASGAGKSSFLRAGLWPRLVRDDRNFLPITVIRPELAVLTGKHGLYQALSKTATLNSSRESNLIAKNLPTNTGDIGQYVMDQGLKGYLPGLCDASRIPLPDGKLSAAPTAILSVDQAEELFGLGGSNESDLFVDILTKVFSEYLSLIVIFAIRSDAYPQVQTDQRLTKISQNEANLFNLEPMEQGSYRTIIEEPARLVKPKPLGIEPLLTEALLESSRGADALPLLAFTLERLYENYGKDGDLTLDEYNKMGRLKGAIEAAVNDSYNKALTSNIVKGEDEFKKAIKAAFIPHLTDVNDANQFVRRVAVLEKLPSHTHDIIELLVDQHLLMKDRRESDNGEQNIVEVAHEALLREWPLLRRWLEEEKDSIRAIGAVSRSAAQWKKNDLKDEWLVHTGDRLNEAMKLSMRDDMQNRIGDLEKKYLQAAIDKVESDRLEREEQQKREQALKEQSDQRKTWVMRISFAAGVVAIILGTIAVIAYFTADEERKNARDLLVRNYWSNALDSKAKSDWLSRLHYAARAGEIATKKSLIKNAIYTIQNRINFPLTIILEHEDAVSGVVFNLDGARILTWSRDNTARLWDAADGTVIGEPMRHDDEVSGALFNRDGARILTWSRDNTARLWDAADGTVIGEPMRHGDRVSGALFNRDETRILTWSDDKTARLWNAADGTSIGEPMKHDGYVRGALFNRDETRILTWSRDKTARLWDAADGATIGQPMKHDGFVFGAVFNRGGSRILTWGSDGTARLWDAADGASIGEPMRHGDRVSGALFNRDGTRILTWSRDKKARLWDAADGAAIGEPMTHDDFVDGAVFNREGTRILTWSLETGRLWDAADGAAIGEPMMHDDFVDGAVFNRDGVRILTLSRDKTARLWDVADGMAIGEPMRHNGSVYGAVFNRDGTRILTWSLDKTARLWDAADGASIGEPMKHDGHVSGALFNRDGTRILTWSWWDNTARLWDAADGAAIGEPMKHDGAVSGALFNRDGTRILTWSGDKTARLWDAADGAPIGQSMKHKTSVSGALYNQDETRILTWSGDKTGRLWDIEVDDGFPKEYLPLMVRVATGTVMDDYGNVTALSKKKWEEQRAEYIRIAEEHIKNCKHKNKNIYLNYQKPNWDKE